MSDLRARQKALARRAIAEAAGELATERRHLDFSLQEVADRAGVSLRTVYNHFANREALLDGLLDVVNDRFRERGGMLIDDVTTFDDLYDGVRLNFPIFEELGDLIGAASRLDEPESAMRRDHDERTDRIVELVAEAVPDLDDVTARRVALMVRHGLSWVTWVALTQDYGMTTAEAAATANWSIRTMMAAAARGDVAGLDDVP